jgi:hypothetical protein
MGEDGVRDPLGAWRHTTNRNSLTVIEPEHGRLGFRICRRTQDCHFVRRLAQSGGRLIVATGLLSSWSDGKRSIQDVRS